jgi:hypothetical protein
VALAAEISEAMRKGWTKMSTTGRWVTVWTRKEGHVALNAFPSGNWSITCKASATDDNPHGILASSFMVDLFEHDLPSAMEAAERAAKEIGAVPLQGSQQVVS